MSWGAWMAVSHSLEKQAHIEAHRREVRVMPEPELRALADSMVCQAHDRDLILRNAMKRIAELEVQRALVDTRAIARSLRPRQSKLWAVLRWIFGVHH